MATPFYFSPLRYPGGKGKLVEYVKEIITTNSLQDGCYVEPYAGGAAVAIELLLLDYVSRICINDLNASVHAFWKSVLDHTDDLCELIARTPITVATWQQAKGIQTAPSRHSVLEHGFATFVLNRCNRSGVLAGGIIGGYNQQGKWKIDARFNRDELIGRIQQIARFRGRIELSRMDAVDFLKKWTRRRDKRALVYLDPPYYVKGKGLYDNFYTTDDHAVVANYVTSLNAVNWIVSYDDVPAISALYKDFRSIRYSLSYSARERYKGGEVMFFSHGLVVPPVPPSAPIRLIGGYESAGFPAF